VTVVLVLGEMYGRLITGLGARANQPGKQLSVFS